MAIEKELKYLLSANQDDNGEIADKITSMLRKHNTTFILNKNQLNNDYFDNSNLALKKMDIGLRIREFGKEYEQTVKTAGKIDGCFHQRPEYNVAIKDNHLDLLLFPEHIWPVDVDVFELQQSLQVIFKTNFLRQTWVITQENSVIELAFDRGEIFISEKNEILAINELEIELVSGDEQALFILANQLMEVVEMKPGKLSKAARGYALYDERENL
jgi:triphosphatase